MRIDRVPEQLQDPSLNAVTAWAELWFKERDEIWRYAVGGFLVFFALGIWGIAGLTGLAGSSRVDRTRRKQLALLYATLDRDLPGTETHYLHDDQIFARRTQRFLADHHVRYPVKLYDARGRYLFHSRPKLQVLSQALNTAVARGRDNELFVIMADLIELVDELDHLMRSIRVAVARHHQVLVIVPWQDDIPEPPREALKTEELTLRKSAKFSSGGHRALAGEIRRDAEERYHKNYFRLRKELGKLGVVMIRADHGEAIQAALDRLDRLRSGRR